ncbi:hypothetical protein PoB_006142000 [Plakobranchus ocellatus]|uniref:Uncharacterized protein n=1 Tax=Plakobranchus ocellatus TaxID=259542 RepID=A0AAV4CSU2_9GAST|nr:hypothetical protein PoB_006142000 [Plakobranchus ocellatus]
MSYLYGEVKAMCIPDTTCDAIVGKVEVARDPEDPDMSLVVVATMTRAQALRETVTRPLRASTAQRHSGVDRDQLISLQQGTLAIQ